MPTDQMPGPVLCPQCRSAEVHYSERLGQYRCIDCGTAFTPPQHAKHRRIFLSYGHDRYAIFADGLKQKLQERGHEAWFDAERLKHGRDWERYIEHGLEWVAETGGEGCVVLLMTPHSVRRPDGYCLNELARATSRKIPVVPVMLATCEPPLSIARILWLDMRGCAEEPPIKPFEPAFERLLDALEHNNLDFEGANSRLLQYLSPPDFSADIRDRLRDFVGREWLFERVRNWLDDPSGSRLFWITGGPGVGKSALAAQVAQRFPEAVAFHACVHRIRDKADPGRVAMSIAYQLATQLPDYLEHLATLDLSRICSESDAETIFDSLLVQPFAVGVPSPGRTLVVVIDALEEATHEGTNDLARIVASAFPRMPAWLRLVATSRPEVEVKLPLQVLDPYVIDAASKENLDDLKTYLHSQLSAIELHSVSEDTIERMIARSEGLFLYVVWVIQELRANRLSLEDVESLPRGLGGIYLDFFERQFGRLTGKKPPAEYAVDYRPALELVVSAFGDLPVSYVAKVLEWNGYKEQEVLAALGSLFPTREGVIQPFHLSVLQWLRDGERAGPFRVDATAGHRRHVEWGLARWREGNIAQWPYVLGNLPAHLEQASIPRWQESLQAILLDVDWISARLRQSGTTALVADYARLPGDGACRSVARALRQSAHVLARDPSQLGSQLWGRFAGTREATIAALLKKAAARMSGFWLRPLQASLRSALVRTQMTVGRGWVNALAVLADGRLVLGGYDGIVRIFNEATDELEDAFYTHGDRGEKVQVNAMQTDSQGRLVVALCDGWINVWDPTKKELKTIEREDSSPATALMVLPKDRIVLGLQDGSIVLCDLAARVEDYGYAGPAVTALAMLPNGKLVSGGNDGTVQTWNLKRLKLASSVEHPTTWTAPGGSRYDPILLALLADGRLASAATMGGRIVIWNRTVTKVETSFHSSHGVKALVALPDGRLASGDRHGRIELWNPANRELTDSLEGFGSAVEAMAVLPDGRLSAVYGDGTIRLWTLSAAGVEPLVVGHRLKVTGIVALSKGKFASASQDGTVKLWKPPAALPEKTLCVPVYSWPDAGVVAVDSIALLPDERLACATCTGIKLLNLDTGEVIKRLPADEGLRSELLADQAEAMVALDDGRLAASYERGAMKVRVWNLGTGEAVTLENDRTAAPRALLHVAGRKLTSVPSDIRLWDITASQTVGTLLGGNSAMAVLRDGCLAFASGSTIKIWNLETGKAIDAVGEHDSMAYALVALGPEVFASAASDTIQIWSLHQGHWSGTTVFVAGAAVTALAFDESSGILAVGDASGRVHFFTIETRGEANEMRGCDDTP